MWLWTVDQIYLSVPLLSVNIYVFSSPQIHKTLYKEIHVSWHWNYPVIVSDVQQDKLLYWLVVEPALWEWPPYKPKKSPLDRLACCFCPWGRKQVHFCIQCRWNWWVFPRLNHNVKTKDAPMSTKTFIVNSIKTYEEDRISLFLNLLFFKTQKILTFTMWRAEGVNLLTTDIIKIN